MSHNYYAVANDLLTTHFGITCDDVGLEESALVDDIMRGSKVHEVINEWAESEDLVRIDKAGAYGVHCFIALTPEDEARAVRRALRSAA